MKPTRRGNILAEAPEARAEEVTEIILSLPARSLRFERIFSEGQASPPGFWYDQAEDEWVLLYAGGAEVELAEPSETHGLSPGDWLYLPAGRRHRVKSTRPGTVWLAVFAAGADMAAK